MLTWERRRLGGSGDAIPHEASLAVLERPAGTLAFPGLIHEGFCRRKLAEGKCATMGI
jgi:hypothetical protein